MSFKMNDVHNVKVSCHKNVLFIYNNNILTSDIYKKKIQFEFKIGYKNIH